jgi:hypothetical protein
VGTKQCGCRWQGGVVTAMVTLHEFPIRVVAMISTKRLTAKITRCYSAPNESRFVAKWKP